VNRRIDPAVVHRGYASPPSGLYQCRGTSAQAWAIPFVSSPIGLDPLLAAREDSYDMTCMRIARRPNHWRGARHEPVHGSRPAVGTHGPAPRDIPKRILLALAVIASALGAGAISATPATAAPCPPNATQEPSGWRDPSNGQFCSYTGATAPTTAPAANSATNPPAVRTGPAYTG
jgi:hypothetical protein